MESNKPIDSLMEQPKLPDYPPVLLVIIVLLGGMLACTLFSFVLLALFSNALDVDLTSIVEGLDEGASLSTRNTARWTQGLSHIFMFILPAWIALAFYERGRRIGGNTRFSWKRDLNLDLAPSLQWLVLGILLLVISLPFVHYSYELNKALPLPDWMRMNEDTINTAIKGLLVMDSPMELITTFFIVAVLPGIGEELLFRGVLQQQMQRRMGHWPAIILAAAIFSAIHLQFEGFIPRWLLGIVLGWLFWRTGNLWVPIIVHLLNNGLQVLGYHFFKNNIDIFNIDSELVIPIWAAVISLALVLGFLWYFDKPKPVEKEMPFKPRNTL